MSSKLDGLESRMVCIIYNIKGDYNGREYVLKQHCGKVVPQGCGKVVAQCWGRTLWERWGPTLLQR